MELFEKTLDSKVLFSGHIFTAKLDTVELENGRTAPRETVHLEHAGVAVLAVDEEGEVYFVRQFRYPYREVVLELPAGKVEPGESPADCAKRELAEEAGLIAESFTELSLLYPSPGFSDELLYVYEARGLSPTSQHLDDDEFLKVVKMPFEKAVSLAENGGLHDAKTIVGILRRALSASGKQAPDRV